MSAEGPRQMGHDGLCIWGLIFWLLLLRYFLNSWFSRFSCAPLSSHSLVQINSNLKLIGCSGSASPPHAVCASNCPMCLSYESMLTVSTLQMSVVAITVWFEKGRISSLNMVGLCPLMRLGKLYFLLPCSCHGRCRQAVESTGF